MHKEVAIIGSGIAGLSLAHELSCLGIESVLIDRLPLPGGHAASFACKATDSCQRCGACIVQDYVSKVTHQDIIELSLNCEVLDSVKVSTGFELSLFETPTRISQERCSKCGICKKVCPQSNAILVDPFTGSFFINNSQCLRTQNFSCSACEQACPEDAISLSLEPDLKKIEVNAVAIASGFEPFDASTKTRFGYGRIPGVISSLDLEDMLRRSYFDKLGEKDRPSSISFIQCVGSRDLKIGRNYCSRVCCGYAMRSARLLKYKFPELKVSMFYMDLQTFDRDFENRIMAAAKEVTLVRGMPSEIRCGSNGKPEVIYNGNNDEMMVEEFDLVTLSVGMGPASIGLRGVLGSVNHDAGEYGNLEFGNSATCLRGAYLTGSALGPRTIQESIEHSVHVAREIELYISNLKSGVDVE